MSCEKKFKDYLRQHGFRLTPQREAVLEALHDLKGCTTTAEQLHERACPAAARNERGQADGGVDLATVYRTLELLAELGFVKCIQTGQKERLWEFLGAEEHPHPHMLCRACGRLTGLEEADVAELRDCLRQRYGFEPSLSDLTIPGLCPECRSKS
jgi:Fur family ferric uptake transcriptional regulator